MLVVRELLVAKLDPNHRDLRFFDRSRPPGHGPEADDGRARQTARLDVFDKLQAMRVGLSAGHRLLDIKLDPEPLLFQLRPELARQLPEEK